MQTDDVVRKKDVIVARTEKSDQHRTEIQQVRCACGAACGRSRLWRLMGRRWLVGAGQRPPDHDAARRRGRARDDRAGQDRGARPTPLRLCRACVAVQMYACVGCGRAVCGCARAADGGHVRGGQAQNKNNMLESELQQLAEHGNQRQVPPPPPLLFSQVFCHTPHPVACFAQRWSACWRGPRDAWS